MLFKDSIGSRLQVKIIGPSEQQSQTRQSQSLKISGEKRTANHQTRAYQMKFTFQRQAALVNVASLSAEVIIRFLQLPERSPADSHTPDCFTDHEGKRS